MTGSGRKAVSLVAGLLLLATATACGGDGTPTRSDASGPSEAESSAADQHPSVDDMFTVAPDGRKDALVCWGEGKPTVLLETGGTNLEEWTGSNIVSELAPITQVCTYDRAGTGRSDPAPNRKRDADDVVNEASTLLKSAHIDGPFVLMGRSFGGMIVTHYAEVMPDDVAGVIVLDTPAPSAEFTQESEPELVWDFPGNTERLDVVGGFENRFAKDPPRFDAPLLLITPVGGEASAKNESFWLKSSPDSRQVELSCGDDATAPPCSTEVATFVKRLGAK